MENNVELDEKYLSSLPKQKWCGDDDLVQLGGFWYMHRSIKSIQRVMNHFNPLPSDVIMATCMKTGTTWLKSLLYSILNRSSKHKLAIHNPHHLVHSLEEKQDFTGSDDSSSPNSTDYARRLFSTHIPYQLLAETLDSCECKVVYLTRNPKDTVVSWWHFVKQWNTGKPDNEAWSLDEAADTFCNGVIPFGPYYDHVIGYRELSLKRPENVMFLTYEDMKEDPHGYVKKLGNFLGCPFQEEDEDEVVEIVKNYSIEVLSKHDVNKSEESLPGIPVPSKAFFRKGKIGDHKNHLTDDVIQRIDTLTKHKFHSLGFMYGI